MKNKTLSGKNPQDSRFFATQKSYDPKTGKHGIHGFNDLSADTASHVCIRISPKESPWLQTPVSFGSPESKSS